MTCYCGMIYHAEIYLWTRAYDHEVLRHADRAICGTSTWCRMPFLGRRRLIQHVLAARKLLGCSPPVGLVGPLCFGFCGTRSGTLSDMKLTAHELAGVTSISLFVSLVHTRYWHEAPLAERAPFNDFKLLKLLHEYPARKIREAAIRAFSRHLWYFSEHLVPLVLFDDRASEDTKAAMVKKFSRSPNKSTPRRLDKKNFNHQAPLETYATSRSLNLFNLLRKNGLEEAQSFLSKPPAVWSMDPTYQLMKANVKLLKVVSDFAERGVALIQSYNDELTKDETQKQYLLQLVSSHRKLLPVLTKVALMNMK